MTFAFTPARRTRVPLLIALSGPTGSGKTFSALRLATGIAEVAGGTIGMIDTEASRGLHYADDFRFVHCPLGPPFSPARYLEAIEAAVEQGIETLVIDSGSHEHEGPGGVLEAHDETAKRMARGKDPSKYNMPAWGPVKRERRRLINRILQLPINLLVCFRAKEKLAFKRGEDPTPLGWMAITGDEWIYEMGVSFLLHPGSAGVPTWSSDFPGEAATIKRPKWAVDLIPDSRRIDEKMGAALASWAAGATPRGADELVELYAQASDAATIGVLERDRRAVWASCSKGQKERLKSASDEARARVEELEARPAEAGENPGELFDPSTGEVHPDDEPTDEELGL